ncbi:MAG: thiamine-monophosphate kinase [Lentisphaeria bacterium]|nr:thiamine-monophosphate kinase [Lentisphaeria bacterium]
MDEETFTGRLAELFAAAPSVHTGIGDDCAVLDTGDEKTFLLAAADQVISSVHFLPGTPPEKVAAKLLKRNISDICAMGGIPLYALVTVAGNPLEEETLLRFHRGLEACARAYEVSIIGGDTAKCFAPGLVSTLTILGKVEKEKLCLRKNAAQGDFLYATGVFGNSFLSEHHLSFAPRVKEGRFLAGKYTSAMMDVSDGLLKDARRLAAASGLSVEIEKELVPLRQGATPKNALSDGEDYELIFAVSPEKSASLEKEWPFPDVPLTRIGRFTAKKEGEEEATGGFDHLAGEKP